MANAQTRYKTGGPARPYARGVLQIFRGLLAFVAAGALAAATGPSGNVQGREAISASVQVAGYVAICFTIDLPQSLDRVDATISVSPCVDTSRVIVSIS